MTTTELDQLRQTVGVKQALQNLQLDQAAGDTGLQVQNNIVDDKRVQLTSMVDGLTRPPIPITHAERVLNKKLADGTPAFWIPGLPYNPPQPIKGAIKCMLHPDFDETNGPAGIDRAFIDQAGLEGFFCNRGDPSKPSKDNFTSVFDRDQHMKHKHKTQWELIEAAINKDEDRDEKTQRQLDREVLMALARAAGGNLTPQAIEQAVGPNIRVEPPLDEPAAPGYVCETCQKPFTTSKGVATHIRMSKDAAHVLARAS